MSRSICSSAAVRTFLETPTKKLWTRQSWSRGGERKEKRCFIKSYAAVILIIYVLRVGLHVIRPFHVNAGGLLESLDIVTSFQSTVLYEKNGLAMAGWQAPDLATLPLISMPARREVSMTAPSEEGGYCVGTISFSGASCRGIAEMARLPSPMPHTLQ